MTKVKNRLISGVLSFVMVLTAVLGILPPIEVSAISPEEGGEGNLYISSPSHDDEINGYEDIKIKWNKVSGAHHYWLTVKDTVKGTNLFNKSVGTSTSYTISYDDDVFVTDGRVYKIYVAAMDSSGKVLNGAADWNAIYVTNYLELEYDIEVETIDTDGEQTMNTLEMCAELYIDSNVDIGSIQVGFEYGVKGGTQRKGTTVLRKDGDEFGWELTGLSAGTTYTYRGYAIDPVTGEYIYGDRITITTLDEEDFLPEVYTDSATDITLTSAVINGELEFTADLSTEYGFILGTGTTEQVKIGTSTKAKSFEYEWDYLQPNTKYTYKTYAKNKYGTVYGTVKTFTTKSDTTKPVIEVLKSSLGNEFAYGSTVTFTAEASDNVALSEFFLYIDNTQVDYSDYYTDYEELEYTTNTLSAGTHIIKAYAVDDGGNAATKTLTITVTESAGTGIIGDVNSDGQVTNLDRFILNRYLGSMSGYTANMVNKESADIDGDGQLLVNDSLILARHLFGWTGYDDLSAFYVGPTTPPVTDTSKWNMSFSSNAVTIEVKLASGTPDSSKNYLFVAEDTNGLHYSGIIDAGKTSASFSVKGLQMPRGEIYSYYVLPEGVVLAGNKNKYCIGKCVVPLFNGNMITSVKSDGRSIAKNGNIFIGDSVTIGWDGSYGVENFKLVVTLNGKEILSKTYNHDGPGVETISADKISSVGTGKMIISGYVEPSTSSGLPTAVSTWSGNVIEAEVEADIEIDPVSLLNDKARTLYNKNEAAAYLQMETYYYWQAFSDELTGGTHWESKFQNIRADISNVVNGVFSSPTTLVFDTDAKSLIKQAVRTKLLAMIGDEGQLQDDLEGAFDVTNAAKLEDLLNLQHLYIAGNTISNTDLIGIIKKVDFRAFNSAVDGASVKKVFDSMQVVYNGKTYKLSNIFNITDETAGPLKAMLQQTKNAKTADQLSCIENIKNSRIADAATLKGAMKLNALDGIELVGKGVVHITDMISLNALNNKFEELESELLEIQGASTGVFKEAITETINELKNEAYQQIFAETAWFVAETAVDLYYGKVIAFVAKKISPYALIATVANGVLTALADTDTINKGQLALPHIVEAMNNTISQIEYTYSLFMMYPTNTRYYELEALFHTYKFQVELGAEIYMNINMSDYNSYLKRFARFVNPFDNDDSMPQEIQACYDQDINKLSYVMNWFGFN